MDENMMEETPAMDAPEMDAPAEEMEETPAEMPAEDTSEEA